MTGDLVYHLIIFIVLLFLFFQLLFLFQLLVNPLLVLHICDLIEDNDIHYNIN